MCKKIKKKPPCEECSYNIRNAPKLSYYNSIAWEIYSKIRTQLRVAYGGVIGLDYNVIFQLFDIYGIDHDERETLLERIRIIEYVMLEHLEEKRKQEEKKQRYEQEAITRQNTIGSSIPRKHIVSKTITGNR